MVNIWGEVPEEAQWKPVKEKPITPVALCGGKIIVPEEVKVWSGQLSKDMEYFYAMNHLATLITILGRTRVVKNLMILSEVGFQFHNQGRIIKASIPIEKRGSVSAQLCSFISFQGEGEISLPVSKTLDSLSTLKIIEYADESFFRKTRDLMVARM